MCVFGQKRPLSTVSAWLQSGCGRHAGERVQRMGDHHHLPAEQQAAGGGGALHQTDGQHVRLHDLHLGRGVHVQPAGHRRGPVGPF